MKRMVKALTGKGLPIVTVLVDEGETLGDILDIITDQLTQNPSRRAYLDKWRNDGYVIQCGEET